MACLLICGSLQCRCFPAPCPWVWLLPLTLPVFLGRFRSGTHLPAQPAVEGAHVSLGRCIWGECWPLMTAGAVLPLFYFSLFPTLILSLVEWVGGKGGSVWLLFLPFFLLCTEWWCFTGEAAPGRGSFSCGTGLSGREVTWGSSPESTDQHPTATMCILLSKVKLPISSSPTTRNDLKCPSVHCFNTWRGRNVGAWVQVHTWQLKKCAEWKCSSCPSSIGMAGLMLGEGLIGTSLAYWREFLLKETVCQL